MRQELLIREVFRLSSGTTVLACQGSAMGETIAGRHALLLVDGQVRQKIVLSNERTMRNQTTAIDQIALETLNSVELLQEEIQSGKCHLVMG